MDLSYTDVDIVHLTLAGDLENKDSLQGAYFELVVMRSTDATRVYLHAYRVSSIDSSHLTSYFEEVDRSYLDCHLIPLSCS